MTFENAQRLHAFYVKTNQTARALELEAKHPKLISKTQEPSEEPAEEKPKKSKKK